MAVTRDARETISELFKTKDRNYKAGYGCTVVSLLPLELSEDKPHMLPSTFKVPAASKKTGIAILHVGEGIHYIPHPIEDISIKQTTPPYEMARSVVQDYASAQIALGENAGPGIFWVEGLWSEEEILSEFKSKIETARIQQRNWFLNLVGMADADWNKNHNIMAVSDIQKLAAESLGIKKDWVNMIPAETIACPYCNIQVNPIAVKCFNCNEVINKEAYKKLKDELEGVN